MSSGALPFPPATSGLTSDLALPAVDGWTLVRRGAPVAAAVVVAALAFLVVGGPLRAFADALSRALDADPRWVGAGAVLELLSFAGYVVLLWLVGGRASARLDLSASAQVTLGGAAATRLLPAGGVGGAALTIWSFRRAGLGARGATRTLLAFLVVLYAVFLGSIVVAGGLLALGLVPSHGPLALAAIPAAGAALAIAAALALAARRPVPEPTVAGASGARARVRRAADALGVGVRDGIGIVRSGDIRLLGAPAWWAFDAAVLWAMLHALGAPPSVAVIALAYFVGQVANTIPIPGAVSGGTVGVLVAFGVETDLALASVLAYRAMAAWLPAPIGLAALAGLRRTVGRWSRENVVIAPVPAVPSRTEPSSLPGWRRSEPLAQVAA